MKQTHSFFAILSDIHANLIALEAVFADIARFPVRATLCLGDIIGYGPDPAACVERIRESSAVTVLGNHEAMLMLADKILEEDWDVSLRKPLRLAKEQLDRESQDWLSRLPITADLDPITLCHASLNEPPEFHYLREDYDVDAHFAAQTTFIAFCGHTHVPSVWEETPASYSCNQVGVPENPVQLNENKRYVVNVGSVGQPRDGDPRASYALYDHESRILLHRRVPYDIVKAQIRFRKTGMPAFNAVRLTKGE